jgi:hypothetical protein
LLDALQAASSRVARRMIYERLRTEGTALFPELRRRLNGAPPWYFVRNLLALMRDIGVRLGGADGGLWISDVAAFQSHPREQVRMEALRMLVHDLRSREAAICRALDDDSPRIVTAAGDAAVAMVQGTTGPHEPHATGEVPSRVVLTRDIATRLMRVVDRADDDALVQVRAIRALAAANGPTVRSWLLQRVTKRSRLLRRLKRCAHHAQRAQPTAQRRSQQPIQQNPRRPLRAGWGGYLKRLQAARAHRVELLVQRAARPLQRERPDLQARFHAIGGAIVTQGFIASDERFPFGI